MFPERLFIYFYKGWGFKHFYKYSVIQLYIMSQQMSISSFIVREDQQSFYSLHFDFHNYTVAAALGPEIFLRRLRNKHNYCPSGALVPYTALIFCSLILMLRHLVQPVTPQIKRRQYSFLVIIQRPSMVLDFKIWPNILYSPYFQ